MDPFQGSGQLHSRNGTEERGHATSGPLQAQGIHLLRSKGRGRKECSQKLQELEAAEKRYWAPVNRKS